MRNRGLLGERQQKGERQKKPSLHLPIILPEMDPVHQEPLDCMGIHPSAWAPELW